MRYLCATSLILAVAVLLVASLNLAGAPAGTTEFHDALAQRAKMELRGKFENIEREARRKTITAEDEYVSALRKAQDEATHRADLDEAIRIRDEIARIKTLEASQAGRTPDESPLSWLGGTRWQVLGIASVHFDANGRVAASNGVAGRYVTLDPQSAVLVFDNGVVDVWRFDGASKTARITSGKLEKPFLATRMSN